MWEFWKQSRHSRRNKQARKVQVQSVSFPLSVLLHSLSAKTFLAWIFIIPLAMQANNVLNPQIC